MNIKDQLWNSAGCYLDDNANVAGITVDHVWGGSGDAMLHRANAGEPRAIRTMLAQDSVLEEIDEGQGKCQHCQRPITSYDDLAVFSAVHLPALLVSEQAITFGIPYCNDCAANGREAVSTFTKDAISKLFEAQVERKQ